LNSITVDLATGNRGDCGFEGFGALLRVAVKEFEEVRARCGTTRGLAVTSATAGLAMIACDVGLGRSHHDAELGIDGQRNCRAWWCSLTSILTRSTSPVAVAENHAPPKAFCRYLYGNAIWTHSTHWLGRAASAWSKIVPTRPDAPY
jgi:hypothetical protein